MSITEDQKQFFIKNGYLVLDDFFKQNELDYFEESFRNIVQIYLNKVSKERSEIIPQDFVGKEFDQGIMALDKIDHLHVAHIYDSVCHESSFLQMTVKSDLLTNINQLMDRNSTSPLFVDLPGCRIDPPFDPAKRKCGWHQEVLYYAPKSEFLQIWSPMFNNATRENGTIEICPGSHKEGIAKQSIHEDQHYKFVVDDDILSKYEHITMEMNVGNLLIFSPNLIHRSGNNVSEHIRYSFVGTYHNLDNEKFIPPKIAVENQEQVWDAFYRETFNLDTK